MSQALIYIDRNWIVGHRNNYIGYLNRLLVEKTEGEGGGRAGCRTVDCQDAYNSNRTWQKNFFFFTVD